jgi:hypothetical protein
MKKCDSCGELITNNNDEGSVRMDYVPYNSCKVMEFDYCEKCRKIFIEMIEKKREEARCKLKN